MKLLFLKMDPPFVYPPPHDGGWFCTKRPRRWLWNFHLHFLHASKHFKIYNSYMFKSFDMFLIPLNSISILCILRFPANSSIEEISGISKPLSGLTYY